MTEVDQFTIVDPSKDGIRLASRIGAPGADAGDVMTVQADGYIATAPGGGGGTPNDFLGSYIVGQAFTADNDPIVFDSPPDTSNGTSLTLNGGGDTATVNTTGHYAIVLDVQVAFSATAAGSVVVSVASDTSDDPFSTMGPYALLVPAVISATYEGYVSLPGMRFTAGDTIQARAVGNLSAGTATVAGGSLTIIRTG